MITGFSAGWAMIDVLEFRKGLRMDTRQNSSQGEAEIRDVIEPWAAAVRRRDFEGILQNHSSDIVMFDVPPPFQSKGIEAYKKTWDLFFPAPVTRSSSTLLR